MRLKKDAKQERNFLLRLIVISSRQTKQQLGYYNLIFEIRVACGFTIHHEFHWKFATVWSEMLACL